MDLSVGRRQYYTLDRPSVQTDYLPKEPFQVSTQADAYTFKLRGVVAMRY